MGVGARGLKAMLPAGLFARKTSAETKQTVAFAAYAIGGAALAVGVTLYVLNRPTLVRAGVDHVRDDGVSLTPVMSSDLTGVAASGRF